MGILCNWTASSTWPAVYTWLEAAGSCSAVFGAARGCSELLGAARSCRELLGCVRSCSELLDCLEPLGTASVTCLWESETFYSYKDSPLCFKPVWSMGARDPILVQRLTTLILSLCGLWEPETSYSYKDSPFCFYNPVCFMGTRDLLFIQRLSSLF